MSGLEFVVALVALLLLTGLVAVIFIAGNMDL